MELAAVVLIRLFLASANRSMNLANRLTLSRGVLSIFFVTVLSLPSVPYPATLALAIFLVAGVTDYLDGYIARRFNMMSDFGKLMDPLLDKILVAAAFICLVSLKVLPAWAVVIIIAREFAITGLRLLAASKGQVLSAEKLGKHKTAWQMVTIIYFLGLDTLREWGGPRFDAVWTDRLGMFFVFVTLGFTVYSGVGYIVRHRDLIETA